MRLTILIALRTFSISLLLIALVAVGQLIMGARALFLVQREFSDVSPLKLGGCLPDLNKVLNQAEAWVAKLPRFA